MSRVPFSAYDFFGYLASGFLLLAGIAVVTGHSWLLGASLPASVMLIATFAAYVTGHVVAHLSSSFLEHLLARRLLDAPERILLNPPEKRRVRRFLFRGYYAALPVRIRNRVLDLATTKGWGADERAIFLQGLALVRQSPATAGRLDAFLNLYGFCRNTAMVLVLCAVGLTLSYGRSQDPTQLWLAVGSLGAGVILFLRFLKFYRLYTHEVFLASMEIP